jgi:hypothetical protein
MNTLFLGILLSFVGVLAVRISANADTTKKALYASLAQIASSVIGAYAIIDFVSVNEKLWLYAIGVGIGTFFVIILKKKI